MTAAEQNPEILAIEFYSGIGGWSYALDEALQRNSTLNVNVVAAFDVSTVCNEVYRANHGFAPSQKPIEQLDVSNVDGIADIWFLSPPCQPHTRQRKGLTEQEMDIDDSRSQSFIHICSILERLKSPPRILILENVVGFESSRCCVQWLNVLACKGYMIRQFHLTPTPFGMPNERPRYYCVARLGEGECNVSHKEVGSISDIQTTITGVEQIKQSPQKCYKRKAATLEMIDDHGYKESDDSKACNTDEGSLCQIGKKLELPNYFEYEANGTVPSWLEPWKVDAKTLEKDASWCFDIVRWTDSRSACFTRSYGRFIRGTGSILYVPSAESENDVSAGGDELLGPDSLISPKERIFGNGWKSRVSKTGVLRYFTPREVANLLGFPASFDIPKNIKKKKAYEMLGNSLHVGVAAKVVSLALESEFRNRSNWG